ncbi:TonB-dependent receptor plug domain-containing protein [Massilia sp. G4R7]|uniref:TonB-dependent receptor plug domain-containing protein n=1 Tax=Massilia phyllostachyos TaxID=2898585 RepID=A0ABS8Q6Y1_9BURK|nr:TonB-dependent receptor [Massilia phyllostachyos]MCD2517504.1 TonB-dependent receptor plug domain-containing protein [Massilia phyllostachyos]
MKTFHAATALRHSSIAVAASLLCASLAHAVPTDTPAAAEETPAAQDAPDLSRAGAVSTVAISTRKTRSSVAMSGPDIQKVMPGVSPLKALQALPGVSFQTADPWGNNEQNLSLFVHGFNGQQLGYTMDGVPLGDQQYGNYNGLAPQRALTSENVKSVVLSTGAGDLGTPSTSNLGGTIETYSRDPMNERNVNLQQTVGSHKASRTFLRYDSGDLGGGNSFFVSGLHHEAKAWDFNGRQSNDQFNAKFVHEGESGKLTVFADWSDKIEPNEDSTLHQGSLVAPYTRPFIYPDFAAALAYLDANGAPPANVGANFRNYYSDAQRTDHLAYVKYEAFLSDKLSWTNQYYYHRNDGVGVVAGPINQAGLPALFRVYFPNQDLKTVFGNSGYATRTTEYQINRQGATSTVRWEAGDHRIQAGLWFEHNNSGAYRRWYALDVNNPSTPYQRPSNPLITQYGSDIDNKVVQFHLVDEWKLRPDLTVQGGFKSSLQFAEGLFPVNQLPAAIGNGSKGLPEGKITTKKWFLPQLGARWDISGSMQAFANVQKNMRQFVTYGGGGNSPWSLSSQAAFDYFKATAKPETSVTIEAGLRDSRSLDLGPLTAFDGQVTLYHVNFRDRQLAISSNPIITSFAGGTTILSNVGGVKTDGVDFGGTLHFGRAFSFYDAISYNRSRYQDSYLSGTTVVPTAGKTVPNTPEWMNKFVATFKPGAGIEMQLQGDYVGKRFATYTNDLNVGSYFLLGLNVSGAVPMAPSFFKNLRWSINVTNLADRKGVLQPNVGQASGSYATYPIPPRMGFLTLKADI